MGVNGMKVISKTTQVAKFGKSAITVNRDYQVPYLGATSKNGRTVYIDERFDPMMEYKGRQINTIPFLKIHELREWQFEHAGHEYEGAHDMATKFERKAVEAAGIPWKVYQDFCHKWVKKLTKITGSVPPDLEMAPEKHDAKMRKTIERFSA